MYMRVHARLLAHVHGCVADDASDGCVADDGVDADGGDDDAGGGDNDNAGDDDDDDLPLVSLVE